MGIARVKSVPRRCIRYTEENREKVLAVLVAEAKAKGVSLPFVDSRSGTVSLDKGGFETQYALGSWVVTVRDQEPVDWWGIEPSIFEETYEPLDEGSGIWRKKVIDVEFHRIGSLDGSELGRIKSFVGGDFVEYSDDIVRVRSLEGIQDGRVGDYILKGVKGEHWIAKPSSFQSVYDIIEP